jgi:hypothetical protein
MNRGATLMHYDFRIVAYTTSSRGQTPFIVRAFLKNGKRWAKFPFLTNNTRMIVVGKVCGWTSRDRHLAVLVDDFKFVGGTDNFSQSGSPQTPLSNKRTVSDLWDRSNVDDIGAEGSSTPSKVRRRLSFDQDDVPPSTQTEIPETPVPCGTHPEPSSIMDLNQSETETESGQKRKWKGKQRQRNPKSAKKV